ncbi:F0F1 ATP synthase subunit B family protein [Candidatus Nitrospira allomarina]|jgi:F-type H+-transporting ATPase subunit b|uniref:ATP synthase subunit b n=1 Tax=Candidatus Nitrospira allomarina TaxID=3020900 RepID=A0AA96JTV5_9BACT|nr:F0F1 ATP synthase subunit delta [Candidatus Nitrospira allomarina]WNM59983.1 F0F1 ATP synthase subunit delta [Candidatus Nitrospira allomarina]
MLIDWFTVVAQALNFLILVWLLKRFLYQPILNAIDAREKRIATELADADAKEAEARQERDTFKRKNEEFDQQRAALLTNAVNQATTERQQLLENARKELDILRAQWQEALKSEHQSLSEELSRRAREEVFAIVRKTLVDLATTNLEEQMADAFVRRLHELNNVEREGLESAFKTASTPAIVRSTFHLPATQRQAIEIAVKDVLAVNTHVQFETAPDLVSGIELTANGHKIAWSIRNYLASLQKSVDDLLKVRPKAATTPEAHPE